MALDKLDGIVAEVNSLSLQQLKDTCEEISGLPMERQERFRREFNDVLNDRDFYGWLGANYSSPSHEDILRLSVLAYRLMQDAFLPRAA